MIVDISLSYDLCTEYKSLEVSSWASTLNEGHTYMVVDWIK